MLAKQVEYHDENTLLEGYLACNNSKNEKRPLVLVVHDWSGRNEFACKKAELLAELGYVGFAVDMFGKGVQGNTTEEKSKLIQPFMQDRKKLLQRINAGFECAKKIENIDLNRIAIIGFCFGGLCALDLARSGADIAGVVSFHGLLQPPAQADKKITAKILALCGYKDPMVPPDVVAAFQTEMTSAEVDWQMTIYGQALHAFTNPVAHDYGLGTVYNDCADKRSWIAMKNFLEEIFRI